MAPPITLASLPASPSPNHAAQLRSQPTETKRLFIPLTLAWLSSLSLYVGRNRKLKQKTEGQGKPKAFIGALVFDVMPANRAPDGSSVIEMSTPQPPSKPICDDNIALLVAS
ncbi:expressed unknown protein [Seminavis robusta]|uniref:Uncharacterized protein n=1 Tax=Seminavis robusta TaxID=568900 RepID=A0A9N8HYF1_9STRA|nr:expressed unknown protein [Seminavis robusta]|eukprot:Sro2824_g338021.1  (112) ;mRNA; r:6961-7296